MSSPSGPGHLRRPAADWEHARARRWHKSVLYKRCTTEWGGKACGDTCADTRVDRRASPVCALLFGSIVVACIAVAYVVMACVDVYVHLLVLKARLKK